MLKILPGTILISHTQITASPQKKGIRRLLCFVLQKFVTGLCRSLIILHPILGRGLIQLNILYRFRHFIICIIQSFPERFHCLFIICQAHIGQSHSPQGRNRVLTVCNRLLKICQCSGIIQCFNRVHSLSGHGPALRLSCAAGNAHHYDNGCTNSQNSFLSHPLSSFYNIHINSNNSLSLFLCILRTTFQIGRISHVNGTTLR